MKAKIVDLIHQVKEKEVVITTGQRGEGVTGIVKCKNKIYFGRYSFSNT